MLPHIIELGMGNKLNFCLAYFSALHTHKYPQRPTENSHLLLRFASALLTF